MQSRYYSPDIGRFINADGQFGEDILSSNLFAYCGNNPIMGEDPAGNIKWNTLLKGVSIALVGMTALDKV